MRTYPYTYRDVTFEIRYHSSEIKQTKMNNPTSKQVRYVANKLRSAIIKYPHLTLNMADGHVNHYGSDKPIDMHVCGTSHCHGGTYALVSCDLSKKIDFQSGAKQMAEDLGFENYQQLTWWAAQNPDIWGNSYGEHLFSSRNWAFVHPTKRPQGAQSVCDIVDHWMEVADRLEALEKLETAVV